MADAQALMFGRSSPPPPAAPTLGRGEGRGEGPERKLLTILFVDIVGSSAMVVGRDPEDADTSLLSILTVLIEAVDRYDGTVSQLLGDGFMAVFGAPDAKEDHTLRACLAAQDIVRATVDSHIPGFRVRVGMDSGDAVAHVVRSGQWTDYRTVGECVHVAAKLQQRADPNTAQLSRSALDLVPVGVTTSPAGSLQLTPTARPITAYTLEGARAVRRTATDLLSSTTAPMVGREAEREALFGIATLAGRGNAQVLALRGEAGIGKSRLVGELLRDEMVRDWSLLHWPQMPIRRLGDPDDLEAVAQSLSVLLTGTLSGDGPQRVAEAAERQAGSLAGDAVRALFGLAATNPMWSGLDPSQRLTLAIDGLVGAVVDRAACTVPGEHPLLILVEDAHWARPVMARLLDALAATLTGMAAPHGSGPRRVLLLVTLRPPALGAKSEATGWLPARGVRRIELDALDPEQSRRFLDHWLGDDPSLAELKSKVSARSQGVPLYLEETLRTLEAAEDITGTPGSYRLVNPEISLRLPRSVHALLAARMDLLANDPRRVLMRAAVVGATFDVGLLRALKAVADASLLDELSYLEQAGFVARARLLPNLEYVFRHALIREVAYITITNGDRKTFHGQVVGALRKRRESDLPNRVELMAHHAFMAEEWPTAYAYGRRAGLRAENRSKLEDASDFYKNSLTALDQLTSSSRNLKRQTDLSIAVPRVNLPRGLKNMDSYLVRAKDLAIQSGDCRRHAQAASLHAAFEWTHGDLDRAAALSHEGLTAIGTTGHPAARIPLFVRLGGILAEQGRFKESCAALMSIRELIKEYNHSGMNGLAATAIVVADSNLARSFAEIGDCDRSIRVGRGAVSVAEESNHVFSKVYANTYMGWSYLLLGMYKESLPFLENALEFCQTTRSHLFLPFISAAIGYAQTMTGGQKADLGFIETWSHRFSSLNPKMWTYQVGIWHAEAMLKAGHYRESYAKASHCAEDAWRSGRRGYHLHAAVMAAEAALYLDFTEGKRLAQLKWCLSTADHLSMGLLAQYCQKLLARVTGATTESHLTIRESLLP